MEILKAIWDFFGLWTVYIGLALLVIIPAIIQTIKGKKKAQAGEDKAKIHKILATVMGEDPYYVPVFATRIDEERNCRKYFFYAIAMQEERMVMVPLSFADDVMGYGTPFEIRKEHLKEVHIVNIFKKKPEAKRQIFDFIDKTPKRLFTLYLNATEVCTDKQTEPVNLYQEEEVLRASKILFRWSEELERENQ